jgi:hypothetical protein
MELTEKKLEDVKTVRLPQGDDNYLVLEKSDFPADIDAGHVDQYITKKYGDVISRDGSKLNGVTMSATEIIIALKTKPTKGMITGMIDELKKTDEVKSVKDKIIGMM